MAKQYIEYLEKIRWKNGISCPYCSSRRITPVPREQRYHCNNCFTTFSVTVGTIFHDTRLDLAKWFEAISMMLNAKQAISGRELGRRLRVNKDTACRITLKVTSAMHDPKQRSLLLSIAEFSSEKE